MKNNLEELLEENTIMETGAVYLVPHEWWEEACIFNFDAQSLSQVQYPHLALSNYVDNFLLEFSQGIIAELQHKSNYLNFSKSTLCPEIRTQLKWKILSPSLWKRISSKLNPPFSLLTYYDMKKPHQTFTPPLSQLQIIFCSKDKSEVFVGYFPQQCNIMNAVRAIGFELGFVEMANSKIVFPEKCPEILHSFHEFEEKNMQQLPDTLLMCFNMELTNTTPANNNEVSFGWGKLMGDSNEAVAGELANLSHQRDDGTMSTGADTPSFVFSEEESGEFRVRELFREKKPEEIKQLKEYSQVCLKGELIPIRNLAEQELQLELEAVALQVIECLNFQKKKIYKQKEIQ